MIAQGPPFTQFDFAKAKTVHWKDPWSNIRQGTIVDYLANQRKLFVKWIDEEGNDQRSTILESEVITLILPPPVNQTAVLLKKLEEIKLIPDFKPEDKKPVSSCPSCKPRENGKIPVTILHRTRPPESSGVDVHADTAILPAIADKKPKTFWQRVWNKIFGNKP